MRTEDRRLRLRVARRHEPDLGKLIEWVLSIAETRHRAWLNDEPDPYGLPVPESVRQLANPEHGPARFAGPSNSTDESET
jgi:hypothetical protein